MHDLVVGFLAGVVVAAVTAPVGVSGAVLLLPIQLSVLHVPSPAVTPTNLLFNVLAAPGALLRRRGRLGAWRALAAQMIAGSVPGVVLGALTRVLVVPGPRGFRALAAVLLAAVGVWIAVRTLRPSPEQRDDGRPVRPGVVVGLALLVGVVGGVYGIGGGSILGPLLVGLGVPLGLAAPAALASTFVTSVVGAGSYALLSLVATGYVAPNWPLGLMCGLGGLLGGYLGGGLTGRVPERGLRALLAVVCLGVAVTYAVQAAG